MTQTQTRTDLVCTPKTGKYFEPPAWEWVSTGTDMGWWVRPGWRETLIGPDGLRLAEWEREGRLTTIKSGPHRVVYHVKRPEGGFYIKHFLVPNFRSTIRQWFRRGKGRNEAKRAERLSGLGVPTFQTLALGEHRKRKFLLDNYLITREIPDATPLDEFVNRRLPLLDEPEQTRVRQRLAAKLGELTARLHEGGFLHIDFHPGNLLVRLDLTDEPQFFMIDLDALRVRKRVSEREAIENLALLNHYFWTRSNRADRFRFLKAYVAARPQAVADVKSFARGVERATRLWAERLWRSWGRRCLGDGKYFAQYKGPRTWAVASRDLDPETVRTLLDDPDAPFARSDATVIKQSRTTTVAALRLMVRGCETKAVYKRFNRKKAFDPVYTIFRPSRAWRAWQNGQHLSSRGIPTPPNLAMIARSKLGLRFLPRHFLPYDTYLVTLKAEPSQSLGKLMRDILPGLSSTEQRAAIDRITLALARLIRLLHERSLSHRDLKADNILLEGRVSDPEPRLSLIDLVGVELENPISRHHQVQNLARLQVSLSTVTGRTRTDALRFLRTYLPWSSYIRGDWKPLWREVNNACGKKRARNRRNRRELS